MKFTRYIAFDDSNGFRFRKARHVTSFDSSSPHVRYVNLYVMSVLERMNNKVAYIYASEGAKTASRVIFFDSVMNRYVGLTRDYWAYEIQWDGTQKRIRMQERWKSAIHRRYRDA